MNRHQQNVINHIALVLDASSSMASVNRKLMPGTKLLLLTDGR